MQNFNKSAMIALLPTYTEWSKLELPHMTLVYAGEIDNLKPSDFNKLAKDAAQLATLCRPVTLSVQGVEVFGDEDKVDVLKFKFSPEVFVMRKMVEYWNASQYPFRPHATIGPAGGIYPEPPSQLSFDKIIAAWGDEKLVFSLR